MNAAFSKHPYFLWRLRRTQNFPHVPGIIYGGSLRFCLGILPERIPGIKKKWSWSWGLHGSSSWPSMESAKSSVVKSAGKVPYPNKLKGEQTMSFTSCKLDSEFHRTLRNKTSLMSVVTSLGNNPYQPLYSRYEQEPRGYHMHRGPGLSPSLFTVVTETTDPLKPRYHLGVELNEEREIWKTKNSIPKGLIIYLKIKFLSETSKLFPQRDRY